MTELEQTRQEINAINQQLAKLLEQRLLAVTKINHYKQAHGLPVLDAQRETKILQQLADQVTDSRHLPFIRAVFQEIMKQSRFFEENQRKEE